MHPDGDQGSDPAARLIRRQIRGLSGYTTPGIRKIIAHDNKQLAKEAHDDSLERGKVTPALEIAPGSDWHSPSSHQRPGRLIRWAEALLPRDLELIIETFSLRRLFKIIQIERSEALRLISHSWRNCETKAAASAGSVCFISNHMTF